MKIDSSVALIVSGLIGVVGGWLTYKKSKSDSGAIVTTTTLSTLNDQLKHQSKQIDDLTRQVGALQRENAEIKAQNAEMLTLLRLNKIDYKGKSRKESKR